MKETIANKNDSHEFWKEKTADKIDSKYKKFIDDYEKDLEFKKEGKTDEKLFAEIRLRMGAYGQRYDNGKRNDGQQDRQINYPRDLTKGPTTLWDAPGMQRIKLPYGAINAKQMDLFADLSEEYSDGISHITTRQDIQLHFIHIENTPSMYRRLGEVGITTKEACGNSVRNVTACPYSGTCKTEAFNTIPYAEAIFNFLLGHPDVQNFGRKFKIALSGCKDHPCALANIHDLGLIAKEKKTDKEIKQGFEIWVGGGLGTIPFKAKLFDDFVEQQDIFSTIQAICRVYTRYGEKKIRSRARIKFLINDFGIDKFKEEVLKEKKKLSPDSKWTTFLEELKNKTQKDLAIKEVKQEHHFLSKNTSHSNYNQWLQFNVKEQKQKGFVNLIVYSPLGDLSALQMRFLADLLRKYPTILAYTTVDQNLLIQWVAIKDLPEIYKYLKAKSLAKPFFKTIVDITACPGTDTCKLGTASSRGVASELSSSLSKEIAMMDDSIKNLSIKISGCFNSCAQHHIADIGFFGISRKKNGYVVPHFQMLLGGEQKSNVSDYGLSMMAFPSKAIPQVVKQITDLYLSEKKDAYESFRDYVQRVGKLHLKKHLDHLTQVPEYEKNKSYYVDWSDVREYSVSDKGIGECAGEIVSLTDFELQKAERQIFDAQIKLDQQSFQEAGMMAYESMKLAAQALIKSYDIDVSNDDDQVVSEFKARFIDTNFFQDPFAGDKFANYYFAFHKNKNESFDQEKAFQRIHEAQLFIEASHACNVRLSEKEVVSK